MSKILQHTKYPVFYLSLAFLFYACSGDDLFRTKPCEEGMVRQGNTCVSTAVSSLGECKDVDLNKVLKGESITMCDGSIGEGTLVMQSDSPLCTKDGEQDCIVNKKFKVLDTSKLDSTKILKGTTIAGVAGSMEGVKQCRNYSDLATLDTSYSPSNIGWGIITIMPAAVNTGSDQITFSNAHGLITNSPVRFVFSTTLPAPLVQDTTYYAIYVSNTVIQLASSPNGTPIDITTQGTGVHLPRDVADSTPQYFDTIDDINGVQSYSPPTNPWNSNEYLCDASNFVNVSSSSSPLLPSGLTPSTGNQAFTQIWQDRISGVYITNILSVAGGRSWSDAIRTCESLNGGTAGDGWHLPTQKELLQLYNHGISKLSLAGGGTNVTFWSSSAYSLSTDGVWGVRLSDGFTSGPYRYNTTNSVLCIR